MSQRVHDAQERWSVWRAVPLLRPPQQDADRCPDRHENLHLKLPILAFGPGFGDAGRLAIKRVQQVELGR